MLILAVDTSGKQGSVALCRGGATSFQVLGLSTLEGGSYSAKLLPQIAKLLIQAEVTKSQIAGLVVVDGPGSFTGLRVGLATVKALCEVMQKPLATVSMLEAMAITYGGEEEAVTAVLDAGRGELYLGEYSLAGPGASLIRASTEKLGDFLSRVKTVPIRAITTVPKLATELGSIAELVAPLRADAIAGIGMRKLLANEIADPVSLDANYIRRADAELYTLPKR